MVPACVIQSPPLQDPTSVRSLPRLLCSGASKKKKITLAAQSSSGQLASQLFAHRVDMLSRSKLWPIRAAAPLAVRSVGDCSDKPKNGGVSAPGKSRDNKNYVVKYARQDVTRRRAALAAAVATAVRRLAALGEDTAHHHHHQRFSWHHESRAPNG